MLCLVWVAVGEALWSKSRSYENGDILDDDENGDILDDDESGDISICLS